MRATSIIALLLGAIALGAGLWFGLKAWREPPAPLQIHGTYLDTSLPLPEFELSASDGEPFTRADFTDRWSFVYFGYTSCPDACPLTLSQFNQLAKLLTERALDQDTAFVLISVDPWRDTPQRLAEYVRFFNPEFRAATGTSEALDKLSRPLGVYYSVPENPPDPDNYLVDHSSAVLLINPAAELQAVFSAPQEAAAMATDFAAIRQHYRSSRGWF